MDWIKGIIGGGGGTRGPGQTLGGSGSGSGSGGGNGSSPRPSAPPAPALLDVTFTAEEKQLGMTIVPAGPGAGRPVVGSVALDGTAHRKGVRKGDRVVAVDGNAVATFDALEATLGAIGRPVTFRLERPQQPQPPQRAQQQAQPQRPGGGVGGVGTTTMSAAERERAARRAAMLAAAEERTRAWDRKGQKLSPRSRARKEKEEEDARFRAASDPETLASVARVKAAENRSGAIYTSHSFGQSQARARIELNQPAPGMPMMSTGATTNNGFPAPGHVPPPTSYLPPLGAAAGAAAAPSSPLSPSSSSSAAAIAASIPPLSQEEMESPEAILAEDELDLALSTLLDEPAARRRTALDTVQLYLGNVLSKPFEEKYRRIRTANAGFRSRVAGVPGATELLTAAGFVFVADGGEGEETHLALLQPAPFVPLQARVVYHRLKQTREHMCEM